MGKTVETKGLTIYTARIEKPTMPPEFPKEYRPLPPEECAAKALAHRRFWPLFVDQNGLPLCPECAAILVLHGDAAFADLVKAEADYHDLIERWPAFDSTGEGRYEPPFVVARKLAHGAFMIRARGLLDSKYPAWRCQTTLLTVSELAEVLGVSEVVIQERLATGALKSLPTAGGPLFEANAIWITEIKGSDPEFLSMAVVRRDAEDYLKAYFAHRRMMLFYLEHEQEVWFHAQPETVVITQ